MKYEIIYSQTLTQLRKYKCIVDAESDEEVIDKLLNDNEYEDFECIDERDLDDTSNFELESVELIDDTTSC